VTLRQVNQVAWVYWGNPDVPVLGLRLTKGDIMTTVLNVQSSPAKAGSASRATSQAFIDGLLAAEPDAEVLTVDLVDNPPAHFGPDQLRAFFAPDAEGSPDMKAALAASDSYLAQLEKADVIVLGAPMHNFSVASTLKAWIDNILRVGKTFRYTETGPVGLVDGAKKVVIVISSGAVYSEGPMAGCDHCGQYLKDILGIIGLHDVTIIRAEGLAYGPEAAEAAMARARADAEALATATAAVPVH